MTSLAERAMITRLSLGLWSGMAVDPEVSEEVSESHRADLKQAGRYSKRLVANHYMRGISSAANLARQTHRILTLPWTDDGTRILAIRGFTHYTEQMRLRRLACEKAFDDFCDAGNVDNYKKEAKIRLGTMYNADEYPSSGEMRKKFHFRVEMDKVPMANDFRNVKPKDLTAEQVDAIAKDIEARGEERLNKAMKDVFQRVYDVTSKMSEKLRDYKPSADGKASENRFRDTLITNALELAELLPSLNVTDDPKITELHKQLKEELGEHSPEILRDDAKARVATAKRAEAIMAKIQKFI